MATVAIGLAISVGAQVLATALTPSPTQEQNKIEDLDVQKSQYGSSIPRPHGRYRYYGCNNIWSPPLKEIKTTKKTGGGKFTPSTKTTNYSYEGTWAAMVCEGTIAEITRIWLNGELRYDAYAVGDFGDASTDFFNNHLELYTGSLTQLPSPTIESFEGVGNVPGLRTRCYVVFRDVPLDNYGNNIPKVDVEVTRDQNFAGSTEIYHQQGSLQVTLQDICELAGFTIDVDLEILAGKILGGASFDNNGGSYRTYIEELQKYFLFLAIISQGKLKFISQGAYSNPPVIPATDLDAREYGSSPGDRYKYEISQARDLPSSMEIEYKNIDTNFDVGYALVTRPNAPFTNNQSTNTRLAMSDSQAYDASVKLLNQLWAQKIRYTDITLMPQYLPWLEPGHIFITDVNGANKVIQISKIAIGSNYLMKLDGSNYDADFNNREDLTTNTQSGYNNISDSVEITTADSATPIILDIPLISDLDLDNGVYFSYSLAPNNVVLSGSLFYAPTTTNDYVSDYDGDISATVGTFTIPTVTGEQDPVVTEIDNQTDFVLNVSQGANPTTISETLFRNFGQLAVLTDGSGRYEIIAFRDVIPQATVNTFTINGVIRGMFGTDQDQFQPGETAIFYGLNNNSLVYRQDYLSSVTGDTFDYRFIPAGFSVFDGTNTVTELFTNRSAKPYPPTAATIFHDTVAAEHTFEWIRGTRKQGGWTQTTLEPPLNEDFESYDFELRDFPGTTVVATFTGLLSPTLTISDADLTTFLGGVPTQFSFYIYQNSASVGRGVPGMFIQKSVDTVA